MSSFYCSAQFDRFLWFNALFSGAESPTLCHEQVALVSELQLLLLTSRWWRLEKLGVEAHVSGVFSGHDTAVNQQLSSWWQIKSQDASSPLCLFASSHREVRRPARSLVMQ
ncbi:unnamed protein product [Pleuronectes platessa]|uniref:Uncharacterized protein n=1 Tax=Pleuronectes platessa TaxID=8262 RepID=A0A9N7UWI1_PLEPL|nr:unnamed protein product [Pleuronectes platessa]